MANAKEIKRKIKSIQNTSKITKAMELISTVKMKKAQDLALSKKDFVLEMLKIFTRLESFLGEYPFFQDASEDAKTLGIIITSNKGLCGGYNVNVLKRVNEYVKENEKEDMEYVAIGKKAAAFIARTWNTLVADYSPDFTDNIEPVFIKNIMRPLYDDFLGWKYNKVVVFYNHYVNSIRQIPLAREFLPIESTDITDYLKKVAGDHFDIDKELDKIQEGHDYDVEPSMEDIAYELIPMVLDLMFYDILLEAKASEHSARMIAMKAAKDNSKKIADDLTLAYNKARQWMITREVSEIVGWVEALKDS